MPSHLGRELQDNAHRLVRFVACIATSAAVAHSLPAQQPPASPQQPAVQRDTAHNAPTRAELESEAAALEHQAQSASDAATRTADQTQAAAIRQRLRDGDFQVGDRIAIVVRGDSTLSDTAAVRTGRTIQLRSLPVIPLAGVLHSELQEYLTKQLAQYLKNPTVSVTPLVQIAVVGDVGHPGFFWVPSDLTLTDAIMLAGGPTQASDLNGTKILRDNKERLSDKQVQRAFASGSTLDQLDMRAGDQITVPDKPKRDWVRILQVTGALAAITVSIIALSRH
ncbi:MAG TPA: polysaccharide biosynthesis/export family protein [Gemmatimonadaceae bacterium]|jgi:protein involved in polysaccharide export with SLBB domain